MEDLNKLIQIDKNIAYNVLELENIEDKQTQNIIKSLLLFFSEQRETDIFGYQTLDPVKFSKKFRHSRQNLFRHIENPFYLQNKLRKATFKWDSYLENALYILASTPVFEEYRGENEEKIIVGLKNYIIINEIACITLKNKGKPKKLYEYKLDSRFLLNLKRFFLNINIEVYLDCRKFNAEDFYLHIMNLYNENRFGGKSSHHFSLQILSNFFYVSDPSPRKVKNKINVIINRMHEIFKSNNIPIDFYWMKLNNEKYPYTLNVVWGIMDKKLAEDNKFKVLQKRNFIELKHVLKDIYLNKEQPFQKSLREFGLWLQRPENKEIIKETFLNILKEDKIKHPFPSNEHYFHDFYRNLLKAKTFKEIFII